MKKRYLKLLPMLTAVLFLAGCGDSQYSEISVLGIQSIECLIRSIELDFIYGTAHRFLLSVVNFFRTFSFSMIPVFMKGSSEYFSNISELVGWFQILALGFIAVKFGWLVLQEYILIQDNRPPMPLMHQIKKLFVAVIMVFTIPTIAFSAYAGSTMLACNMAKGMAIDDEDADIFQKMDAIGANYSTYCDIEVVKEKGNAVTQDLAGNALTPKASSNGVTYMLAPDKVFSGDSKTGKKIKAAVESAAENSNYNAEEAYRSVYNASCAYGTYRLGEGLMKHAASDAASDAFSFLVQNTGINLVTKLLSVIVQAVFWVVSGFVIIKRTMDLVFLVLMSWYYCGESISNSQTSAFVGFAKKLTSICLTQFFVIVEMGVFINLTKNATQSTDIIMQFFNIMVGIVWIFFLLGTPTFIQEMVHDTGVGGDVSNIGGFAGNAFNKIRARG